MTGDFKITLCQRIDTDVAATIEAMHDNAVAFVEKEFTLRGTVAPHYIIRTKEHLIRIVATPEDEETKRDFSIAICAILQLLDAQFYTFLTEAWMAVLDKPDDLDLDTALKKYGAVRNMPEREDVVIISTTGKAANEDRFTRYGVQMKENQTGRLKARDDWKEGQSAGMSGPMFGLMRRPALPSGMMELRYILDKYPAPMIDKIQTVLNAMLKVIAGKR